MAQTLKEWLEVTCKAFDVKPVKVTIDGVTWDGAFYKQKLKYSEWMDAVKWGKKKAGETYDEQALYVIGKLPKCYKPNRENKVCFPLNGVEWYISGYLPEENLKPQFAEFHPFGLNFVLRPWVLEEKIDKYSSKVYTRHNLSVS